MLVNCSSLQRLQMSLGYRISCLCSGVPLRTPRSARLSCLLGLAGRGQLLRRLVTLAVPRSPGQVLRAGICHMVFSWPDRLQVSRSKITFASCIISRVHAIHMMDDCWCWPRSPDDGSSACQVSPLWREPPPPITVLCSPPSSRESSYTYYLEFFSPTS